MTRRRLLLAPALLASVIALAYLSAAAPDAQAETIRVFAAASLNHAFMEIGAAYEKAHPGDRVEFSFGGSQLLRAQIERGAPADLFASADREYLQALFEKQLVSVPRTFAHNRLVAVAPMRSARVRRLQDLARPGVKVVVAGPAVPAGRYTRQSLRKMSGRPPFPGDFHRRVEANVVSRETNVRAVLSKVMLGEADAGIVYATDAASVKGKVRVLPALPWLDAPPTCTIAVVSPPGRSKPQTRAFLREVLSRRGQTILRKHGFLP